MAVNTPLEIVASYVTLLVMQYLNKPNASGFINAIVSPAIIPQTSTQTLSFSLVPTSGAFVLSYNDNNTASINWDDSAATIQGKLQAVAGLASVAVTGSIAAGLTVTFTGVAPPALLLDVFSNSLLATATSVDISIAETDETIPLDVQDAFNLIAGTTTAVGVQLDVLGKYAGVTRTGLGFTQSITLDDADFLILIQMAISRNSAGSSLATIQDFMNRFFPGEIFVYDYQNMTMEFVLVSSVGSQDLLQLFVTEGLLPVPMGVGYVLIYPPSADLFTFRTYASATPIGKPFNDYADYQTSWPWLSYQMAVMP